MNTNNDTKKVIWLGVSPLKQGSDRVKSLLDYIGGFNVSFPDTTTGMETYEFNKIFLKDYDIFATDEEEIDESYENFFCADNWGKRIVQFKDETWKDVMPGFSKERKGPKM